MGFLGRLIEAARWRMPEWPAQFSLEFYALEFVSEAGEFGNEVKKVVREDLGAGGSVTNLDKLSDEVADVLITLANVVVALEHHGYHLLLEEATIRKFNARSKERGFKTRL